MYWRCRFAASRPGRPPRRALRSKFIFVSVHFSRLSFRSVPCLLALPMCRIAHYASTSCLLCRCRAYFHCRRAASLTPHLLHVFYAAAPSSPGTYCVDCRVPYVHLRITSCFYRCLPASVLWDSAVQNLLASFQYHCTSECATRRCVTAPPRGSVGMSNASAMCCLSMNSFNVSAHYLHL